MNEKKKKHQNFPLIFIYLDFLKNRIALSAGKNNDLLHRINWKWITTVLV